MSVLQEKNNHGRGLWQGVSGSFAEMHKNFAPRIERYLYFKLPRKEDAEDLTSEVFARAWAYLQIQPIAHPNAFLYRIARNLIADYYRDNSKVGQATERQLLSVPDSMNLSKQTENRFAVEELLQIIKTLKNEYQEVLRMRFFDDMSVAEIAEALGKTSNNIRVVLFRAKNALNKATKSFKD
ncbi:MAG: sigma-70 family RNA polymerase sigma factor [Patescibacteria group bacterium]